MKKEFKNFGIIALVAVFGFFMIACEEAGDDGKWITAGGTLTVTGLGNYNGGYILVRNAANTFFAGESYFSKNSNVRGGLISNGEVILNAWDVLHGGEFVDSVLDGSASLQVLIMENRQYSMASLGQTLHTNMVPYASTMPPFSTITPEAIAALKEAGVKAVVNMNATFDIGVGVSGSMSFWNVPNN